MLITNAPNSTMTICVRFKTLYIKHYNNTQTNLTDSGAAISQAALPLIPGYNDSRPRRIYKDMTT